MNVIGVGSEANFPNLRRLAARPGDMFTPKSFDDLLSYVPKVTSNILGSKCATNFSFTCFLFLFFCSPWPLLEVINSLRVHHSPNAYILISLIFYCEEHFSNKENILTEYIVQKINAKKNASLIRPKIHVVQFYP